MPDDGQLTSGEAMTLAAMIAEVPAESVVAFALMIVTQLETDCDCGQPENHRAPHVVSTEEDQLIACGILSEGLMQVIRLEAHQKYGNKS